MKPSQVIVSLFAEKGSSEYGGEAVTQAEHALQCAALAAEEGAPDSLIVAALLHDIGHFLHDLPDNAPDEGIDDRHEISGQHFLEKYFDADVFEPVRLHVEAKRYLCTTDLEYFGKLSQPSVVSLRLQGGPMSEDEVARFEQLQYFREAIRLRGWDDEGKISGLEVPGIEHYCEIIERVARKSLS